MWCVYDDKQREERACSCFVYILNLRWLFEKERTYHSCHSAVKRSIFQENFEMFSAVVSLDDLLVKLKSCGDAQFGCASYVWGWLKIGK